MVMIDDRWKFSLICIARVTYVTKKGREQRFNVTSVGSNGTGCIGLGSSTASEISDAMKKSELQARKNAIYVQLKNFKTIPHNITHRFCSTKIILKPGLGIGLRAGHVAHKILKLLGVENVSCKIIGSKNPKNVARCVIEAVQLLETPNKIAFRRSIPVEKLLSDRFVIINSQVLDPSTIVEKKPRKPEFEKTRFSKFRQGPEERKERPRFNNNFRRNDNNSTDQKPGFRRFGERRFEGKPNYTRSANIEQSLSSSKTNEQTKKPQGQGPQHNTHSGQQHNGGNQGVKNGKR